MTLDALLGYDTGGRLLATAFPMLGSRQLCRLAPADTAWTCASSPAGSQTTDFVLVGKYVLASANDLWFSEDGGATWAIRTLPFGGRNLLDYRQAFGSRAEPNRVFAPTTDGLLSFTIP